LAGKGGVLINAMPLLMRDSARFRCPDYSRIVLKVVQCTFRVNTKIPADLRGIRYLVYVRDARSCIAKHQVVHRLFGESGETV